MRLRLSIATALVVSASFVTTACEEAVQPFSPKHENLHYSIYGFLDASADTQWIRVTPVRQSVLTEPGSLDAIVTLENLESGETFLMNDSVFRYESFGLEGGQDAFYHNFWTDAPIEYGTTYRISVTGSEGASTSATVPIPEDVSNIRVGFYRHRSDAYVRITDVEHLAIVQVRHHLVDDASECNPTWRRVWARNMWFPETDSGNHEIEITRMYGSRVPPCRVVNVDVKVVASGDPWPPSGFEYSINSPTVQGFPSNVESGLGFVGGVVSKILPFEDCIVEYADGGVDVCELAYFDGESVSLQGTITDATCGGPVWGAEVRLRQIHDDPLQPAVVRRIRTSEDGSFRIWSLGRGERLSVSVSHLGPWPPDDPFSTVLIYPRYETEIVMENADPTTFDHALERQVPCA